MATLANKFDHQFDYWINPSKWDLWKSCVDQAYADLNWRFAYSDYEVFLKIFGPENFQLHVITEKGTENVIGFVLFATHPSVNGSPRIGQLGCFWIAPKYRGHGLGGDLFQRAVQKETEMGTNLTLNAALHMSPKYAIHAGFDKLTEWKYSNMEVDIGDCDFTALKSDLADAKCNDWNQVDFEKLMDFDKEIFCGVDRRQYLTHYLARNDACTKIAVNNQHGTIVGMCTVKVIVGNRLMLCPLYANRPDIAAALLVETLQAVPNLDTYRYIQFYVPSTNPAAFDLIDRLSQGKARRGTVDDQSQYTHYTFPVPIEKVYNLNTYGLTLI